ncbi:hypothetical protein AMS62_03210 [Bacillus sp. FJAT-18019]|nr:hypothetical protein AMS62_03210 [Bacillus sp. FJAT-18019]
MGFDWGGFAGGVIGTIGAFGTVMFSNYLQKRREKPLKDKQRLKVVDIVTKTINQFWWDTNFKQHDKFSEAINETREFYSKLNSLLLIAIDTDQRLVSIILTTIEQLEGIGKDFVAFDDSREAVHQYQTELMEMLRVREDECNKIRDEILNTYRDKT